MNLGVWQLAMYCDCMYVGVQDDIGSNYTWDPIIYYFNEIRLKIYIC